MGNCMGNTKKKAFEDECKRNFEINKMNKLKYKEIIDKREKEKEEIKKQFLFMKKNYDIPKPEKTYLQHDVDQLLGILDLMIRDAKNKLNDVDKPIPSNDLLCNIFSLLLYLNKI
jgi:hypothetical protein